MSLSTVAAENHALASRETASFWVKDDSEGALSCMQWQECCLVNACFGDAFDERKNEGVERIKLARERYG